MDVAECLERVTESAGALADADLDGLGDAELDETLIGFMRASHLLTAAACRLAARWDVRQVWADDGSRSARARLARDARTSRATAGRLLHRARALAGMPDQCARVVDDFRQRADQELGAESPPPDAPSSSLSLGAGVGGETHVVGHLDPIDGTQVATALGSVVPHLDDVDMQTIVFDGTHRPITASPRRSFVGVLRRAIEAPDRHCQHPSGCDEPIDRCDVDHIVPWRHGGATEAGNARLLCTFHNRINAPGTRPPERTDPEAVANPPPLTG